MESSDQRQRPRWRRRLLAVLGAFVVLGALAYAGSSFLLTAIGSQLVHEDPAERVDVMIVLAPWLDRLLTAADLYREGYTPLIVLTRERRQRAEQLLIERSLVESGEDRRRKILHALGVPLDSIVILDGFASSTADEALRFAEWARSRPIRNVLIVTSPEHSGRARLAFMKALENLQVRVVVRPSTLTEFRRDTWWRSRSTLRDGVLELQKLVYYRLVELPRLVPPDPAAVRSPD